MFNNKVLFYRLRVVLDEGHMIKNHLSKTHKAAAFLSTRRKWVISGTPIQNNLKELWSLLKWLEEPNYGEVYAEYKYASKYEFLIQNSTNLKNGHESRIF